MTAFTGSTELEIASQVSVGAPDGPVLPNPLHEEEGAEAGA